MDYHMLFKLVLTGGCRVGKTSILEQLYSSLFEEEYYHTIGVEIRSCRAELGDTIVKL